MNGSRIPYDVIDSDGHILFPSNVWWKPYLPEKYWDWTPRTVREPDGTKQLYAEGRPLPVAVPSSLRRSDEGLAFRGSGQSYVPGSWGRKDAGAITMAEARKLAGSDPKDRLRAMDTEGIDVAYLFPSQIGSLLPALRSTAFISAYVSAYNDWLADYCVADPRRLKPAAVLPQHDPILAVEEMERARKRGVTAIYIRPNTMGEINLDHPSNERLWAAAEDLDMAACVHEGYGLEIPEVGRERVSTNLQGHMTSHPFEHMTASLVLITSGVLKRHPKLRVAFMESGAGWAPFWLNRMDEHSRKFTYGDEPLEEMPTTYFRRQCFLGIEPDERFLPHLIDFGLEDTLLYGSDFPHVDAIFPGSVAALAERSDISDTAKRKALRDNALRLYGVPE